MANAKSATKQAQPDKTNAEKIITAIKTAINKNLIKKIKGYIIHSWLKDFEDQYLKTFKPLGLNAISASEVVNVVSKRMAAYDYTYNAIIIVRYTPQDQFSVLASKTNEEIEMEEFQRWKKLHKGEKK